MKKYAFILAIILLSFSVIGNFTITAQEPLPEASVVREELTKRTATDVQKLWTLQDMFAFRAELTDDAEFLLKSFESGKCIEYNSKVATSSDLTALDMNTEIDQIIWDGSGTANSDYSGAMRDGCQRFTFSALGNGRYKIVPYLKRPGEDKASYSENDVLGRNSANEVVITSYQQSTCAWTMENQGQDVYTIKYTSGGTTYYLALETAVDEDGQTVYNVVTSDRPYYWRIQALCLNVVKDYQRTNNTCGAASSLMVYKYLTGYQGTEEDWIAEMRLAYSSVSSPYSKIEVLREFINNKLGLSNEQNRYRQKKTPC